MLEAEFSVTVPLKLDGPLMSLDELNAQFYAGYPRSYFRSALLLALAAVHDPAGAVTPLHKDAVIRGDPDEPALKVAIDPDEDEAKQLRDAARLQIGILYFHAFETLVRVFLAHTPGEQCPWMALVRGEGPAFMKKVRKLAAFRDEWTGEFGEDEHFRLAFFPASSVPDEVRPFLTNAKAWLRFAAQECQQANSHHAFKHGLSVRTGQPSFAMFSQASDPRRNADGEAFLKAEGEALTSLGRHRRSDKSHDWTMDHVFMRVTERAGFIFLAQELINAILAVGQIRFVSKTAPTERLYLPPVSPEEYRARIVTKEGFMIPSISMPLGWFDPGPGAKQAP